MPYMLKHCSSCFVLSPLSPFEVSYQFRVDPSYVCSFAAILNRFSVCRSLSIIMHYALHSQWFIFTAIKLLLVYSIFTLSLLL